MRNKLLAGTLLLGLSGSMIAASRDVHGSASPACRVQGVWEMVASIQAGKRTEFQGATQRKLVTKKHWMWLAAATRRDTLPLRTPLDTANYYSINGGYGTYDVSDHRYIEHIDAFVEPKLQGKSLTASCRIEGKQWFHTFLASDLATQPAAAPASRDSITEIWKRVE
jgi:hypothetical protein